MPRPNILNVPVPIPERLWLGMEALKFLYSGCRWNRLHRGKQPLRGLSKKPALLSHQLNAVALTGL